MPLPNVCFALLTDHLVVFRKDFPLADRSLAYPHVDYPLIDGEWMTLDSNKKLIRASDVTSTGAYATKPSFPLFMERGRTDVQMLGKTMILYRGEYEGRTHLYDAAAVVHSGAAITAMWQPLKVATVVVDGRKVTGLVGHGGAGDHDFIRGYVTKLPANGWLEFVSAGIHFG